MSEVKEIIKQGDTTNTYQVSPFVEGEAVENLSDPGWTCRSVVSESLGGTVVTDLPVTTKTVDDLYFETALGPPDTDAYNIQSYLWVLEIENLLVTPVYRREQFINLVVQQQGAPAVSETESCFTINSIGTAGGGFTDIDKVVIDVAALPSGTIKRVDLKNVGDSVIQTLGYISSVVNGPDLEILLDADVVTAPVTICFVV